MVKPKYIAEIGINHNGNIELAKKHIIEAKNSGAQFAKFQTYFTEQRAKPESQIKEILTKCELSKNQFLELKLFCDDNGIEFASTAFCIESVNLLHSIGCVNIKVASFQIGNTELLNHLATQGWIKNLWVSTGMASHDEIIEAISVLSTKGNNSPDRVTFMHCVSQYPIIDMSNYQLNNIQHLAELSGQAAGYSDHTIGSQAAILATALGASFIEKHFTIDNNLEGADHAMSADPKIFSKLVLECEECLEMIGTINRTKHLSCETNCLQFKD